MNVKETNDPLDSFNWDSQVGEVDFFGEVENVTNPKVEELEKKEEEETAKEVKDAETEDEKDIFKELEDNADVEEVEEETEETDKETSEKSSSTLKESLKYLVEQGVVELGEGEDLPEDIDNDYLMDTIDKTVDKKLEESIKSLPEELKNIIKYVHNGGDYRDLLDTLAESSEIDEDIDITDEKNQEKVLKVLMSQDGEDDEIIEAQIEFLKESGKLASIAEKKFNKWKEERAEEMKEQVEVQAKRKQAARESQLKFKKDLSTLVTENQEIKGLSISKKEAGELPSYISDTSVKLQDGRQISPFYKDLFEALKDGEKTVALAKILKSDFDFSDLKKTIVTKSTKELKNNIERQEKKSPKERSSQTKKRLIDYL